MYDAVVIGVSAGGMHALRVILSGLPADFSIPIAIVQHIQAHGDAYLSEYLNNQTMLTVKEAEEKEKLQPGNAYIAPPGYHLLIEADLSFSLSVDEKVNYCRPAVDVLFDSAAYAYGSRLIGIVLTGANGDGAKGLANIKSRGGLAIVQEPKTAESPYMPQAAISAVKVDYVAELENIAPLLVHLCKGVLHGTGT